jgi:alginate O-acetyltransferase complex protein AlgI
MLFNSLHFAIYFAIVYGVYLCLEHRWQNRFLLVASCYFYGSWSWKFFGILALSITIDYLSARFIEKAIDPVKKKRLLVLSIIVNLTLLGFFKYYNFFIDNLSTLLATRGIDASWLHLDLVLPIGISFYTFHSMSYVIDVYHGKMKACHSYVDFSLFVTYFPQLVAGPIARGSQLLPQMQNPRSIAPDQFTEGIFLFCWGLFKKVVIADGCAYVVNAVFSNDTDYGGLDKLLAVYAFAFQIYGDFSGYSDMARGIAKMMGFELMLNFDLPYFATNPSDFWRRWHISLSTWLRDYLYIPLGGSHGSRWFNYRNLFLTMLLGGIWHGASWTMVMWGAYQGLILIIHRIFTGDTARRKEKERPWWILSMQIFLMFQVTCLGWLIFRASSAAQVWFFLRDIFTSLRSGSSSVSYAWLIFELAAPMMLFEWLQYRYHALNLFEQMSPVRKTLFVVLFVWVGVLFFVTHRSLLQGAQPFIYFQF